MPAREERTGSRRDSCCRHGSTGKLYDSEGEMQGRALREEGMHPILRGIPDMRGSIYQRHLVRAQLADADPPAAIEPLHGAACAPAKLEASPERVCVFC